MQNRHLPPLLRFIPQFAQICIIFALSKFEANPFFSASENNSNDLLLSHTLLEGLRKLERCCSRSLALITYTEEVLHIPCLTKPASILCSQVHPEPLAMTLSRLGCCPLLWRDYFDPSFSSPMPVILAWFPSFVLWVIFDLCRYGNTKRVMLTKFAGMQ